MSGQIIEPTFYAGLQPHNRSCLLLYLHKVQCRPQKVDGHEGMRNRHGLKADPWCNPTATLKLLFSRSATSGPWLGILCAKSCISLNILFWYVVLPRASSDVPTVPDRNLSKDNGSLRHTFKPPSSSGQWSAPHSAPLCFIVQFPST